MTDTAQDDERAQPSIRDRASLDAALDRLMVLDSSLVPFREEVGTVPLRERRPDFEALVEIIAGQQVSKAAASAILERLRASLGSLRAATIHAADADRLGRLGLSRAKVVAVRGAADALLDGRLDLARIAWRPAAEAEAALTALKGVGPWTAQVFLLFCAGHRDVFPAGDIALQHAAGWVTDATARPDAHATSSIAERWAGERAAAARLLYALYGVHRAIAAPL